jgi:hypothetical protein
LIISHITGGLGNQMYQYAVGRALSLALGEPLRLDVSAYAGYPMHQGFELERVFSAPFEIATEADVRRILDWQSPPALRRILVHPYFKAVRREGFVVEPHFHYWPGIRNVPRMCYLAGYWQSEKYFHDAASLIRSDFSFKPPLEGRNAEMAARIRQVDAVSLHVRRGDYANRSKTKATHGLCSLDYYRAAVKYITDRVQRPHLFIFSDDIEWVKENLQVDIPLQYVEHNQGAESYNDMHLMSLCRHHIIANSSFSWWGAWLRPGPEKIVLAPHRWFADEKKFNVRDLLPPGWVAL